MEISSGAVKLGEISKVQIYVDAQTAQSLPLQSIKEQTLSETLYVQSVSSMLKHEGEQDYTADAEVIFIKDPGANEIKTTIANQPVRIFWNNVRIEAVEVPKDYVLGNFDIKAPLRIIVWLLSAALMIALCVGLWKFRNAQGRKAALKKERKALKEKILSCRNYQDVVSLWKQKRLLIERFPHLAGPMENLETVLFKYQFKPQQTSNEEAIVMDAYRAFMKESEGGFNGI